MKPPLHDKEMVEIFVSTLQPPFYEHMVRNVSSIFADIIIIGERIEIGLKNGKIAYNPLAATTPKKPAFNPGKKNEVEVHAASTIPRWENQAHTQNYQRQVNRHPYVTHMTATHQENLRNRDSISHHTPQITLGKLRPTQISTSL